MAFLGHTGPTQSARKCAVRIPFGGFVLRRSWLIPAVAVCSALGFLGAPPASAQGGSTGYDVSWPQCTSSGSSSPGGAFAIVGVNDGKPFTGNPCLTSQVATAGSVPVSFYENTANPGPRSPNWPAGGAGLPKPCPVQKRYSGTALLNCAYDYGWNSAYAGFANAPNAAGSQWWLDVESANSWMTNTAANVQDIQGAVDYLSSRVTATNVGIYTNSSSWSSITGSTAAFASLPWWAPGLTSGSNPSAACSDESVTGGHIRYVQWVANNFDMDYDCG